MPVDAYKAFTYFDWDEKSRPEVQIHGNHAILSVGGHHSIDISALNEADLKEQLEGYADIFKAAAKSL